MTFAEVLIRPHSWELPLFLHVAGAMALVGAVGTAVVLSWAGTRTSSPLLARSTFLCLVAVAIPAWILMRVDAEWISSKEGFNAKGAPSPTWLGIGFSVADGGALVLLVTSGLAYWWSRRQGRRAGLATAIVSTLYLAALAVAWLAMTGKWS